MAAVRGSRSSPTSRTLAALPDRRAATPSGSGALDATVPTPSCRAMDSQPQATMALPLGGGKEVGGGQEEECALLSLPADLCTCIAEQLEPQDRVCLAASCRALRAASVDWFRNVVFEVQAFQAPPQHVAWLGRVHAQVELWLWTDANLISAAAAAGARIVKVSVLIHGRHPLPPALAGLAQLRELSVAWGRIQGGWESLPQQLQRLTLDECGVKQLPAALAGLACLTELSLAGNPIEDGWRHLPRQLRRLSLPDCGLQQLPAELAGLTQLSELNLSCNRVQDGWERLPPQLLKLDLTACALRRRDLPAELTGRNLAITGL